MADEILPGLFLGDQGSVDGFPGVVICVMEHGEGQQPTDNTIHIPVLRQPVTHPLRADPEALHRISVLVRHLLDTRHRVLLHCGAGMERSPLAAVWYLHTMKGYSLDSAYALLREKRSVVQDRREWLG